jgi:hypothetical protein
VLIGEIEIDVSAMLRDADIDCGFEPSNCARASSRSSVDLISAALAAPPVAW